MISQLINLEQSIKSDIDQMSADYEAAQKEMHKATLELHNLQREEQKLIDIICNDKVKHPIHEQIDQAQLIGKVARPKSDPIVILQNLKIQLEAEIRN